MGNLVFRGGCSESCSQSWTCIPSMLFKAGLHSWFESNYCVTECICLYIREIHMQMHICQQINYIEQHRTSIQIIPNPVYIYIYSVYCNILCIWLYIYIYNIYIYIFMCVYHSLSASLLSLELCVFCCQRWGFLSIASRFQHNCFELLKDFGSMELRLRSLGPMSE